MVTPVSGCGALAMWEHVNAWEAPVNSVSAAVYWPNLQGSHSRVRQNVLDITGQVHVWRVMT